MKEYFKIHEDFKADNKIIELESAISETEKKILLRTEKLKEQQELLKEKKDNINSVKSKVSTGYAAIKQKNDDSIKRTEKGLPTEEIYSLMSAAGIKGEDAKNCIKAIADETEVSKIEKNVVTLTDDLKKLNQKLIEQKAELSKIKQKAGRFIAEGINEVDCKINLKKELLKIKELITNDPNLYGDEPLAIGRLLQNVTDNKIIVHRLNSSDEYTSGNLPNTWGFDYECSLIDPRKWKNFINFETEKFIANALDTFISDKIIIDHFNGLQPQIRTKIACMVIDDYIETYPNMDNCSTDSDKVKQMLKR